MAQTKEEILQPVMLKLSRAEHHLNELDKEISTFLAEKPFSLMIRVDPNLGKGALIVKQHKPVPDTIPLILGDALHNARASLDILAVGLVGDKAVRPNDVHFPITKSAAEVRSIITRRQIDLVSDEMVQAVEALEPYPGGKNGLYELHALDIADKHKLILVTHRAAGVTGDQMGMLGFNMSGPGILMFVGESEAMASFDTPRASRMARRAAKGPLPVAEHSPPFDGKFSLCFAPSEPFGNADLITKTRDIISNVRALSEHLASLV